MPIRTLAIRDATAMLNDHGQDGVKAVTALTKGLHGMSDVEFVATLWDRIDYLVELLERAEEESEESEQEGEPDKQPEPEPEPEPEVNPEEETPVVKVAVPSTCPKPTAKTKQQPQPERTLEELLKEVTA